MPIKVYCPKCDEPIKARTSEAGTKIDCPECGALVRVPKADRDENDDDRPRRRTDDRDDRPRKGRKGGGKKKAETNRKLLIGLMIGGGVFLMLIVLVGGFVAYRMSLPDADKQMAGEDWYKVDEPDGLFTAYFPGDKPKYEKFSFQPPAILAKKAGRPDELGFGTQSWERRHDGREYSIVLLTLPGSNSGTDAEQAAARARTPPGKGVNVTIDDKVPVGNREARRLVTRSGNKGQASLVMGVGGRQILAIVVSGDGSVDHNDEKVKAFFDNFTFRK